MPVPIKPLDFSGTNVGTPSRTAVTGAASQAISFREQLPDLESKLREALTTKFQASPLFAQRETAMKEFLAAPSQIRADISQLQQEQGPLAPTQQQQITGARRAAAFAPLSTANLLLSSQFGGLETMVGGGVRAFEAASQAQTARANLMNQMRQQEIERQFKEQGIAMDWAKLRASQAKTQQKGFVEQQEAASLISTQRQKIKDIMALVESGEAPTGFFPGLKFQIQKRFGGASVQQAKLTTAYSDFNTRLFEIAGKAFTGPEKDLLQGMILQMGNAPDFTRNQLEEIDRLLYDEQIRQATQFLMQ